MGLCSNSLVERNIIFSTNSNKILSFFACQAYSKYLINLFRQANPDLQAHKAFDKALLLR